VWCAVAVWYCAKPLWLRILALLYPIATLLVIVGTANHFILDAVGGLIVVAAGFGVQWLMSGHPAHVPAADEPGDAAGPDREPAEVQP
jgi:PAP2 superfamily